MRGLDGGRFNFNGADNMPPIDILSKHPLLKGARTIDAFDETYVLKDLNPDIGLIQEVDNNGTKVKCKNNTFSSPASIRI